VREREGGKGGREGESDPMTGVLIKDSVTDTYKGRHRKKGASTSQRDRCQKPTCQHLHLDFELPEPEINFYHLSHPACGTLPWQL
jgi:hypothetical protein